MYDPNANNVRDDGTSCGPNIAVNSNSLTGFPGYCLPYIFESDTLENMEFGWKTTLADGDVQFNGSIYSIDWENIQVSQFDSQNISIFTLIDNGGDAEIQGIEVDLIWAANANWTLYAAGSVNDTELVFVDPAFDIVVADADVPVAIAGVMGGWSTEVHADTSRVLIEAAYWNPPSILLTSKRLGLRSEASARFERGMDPNFCALAADRVAQLLQEIAGGRVAPGLADEYPHRIEPRTIEFPVAEVESVSRDPGGMFAKVEARPLAALDRGREVLLVLPAVPVDRAEETPEATTEPEGQP